MDMDLIVKWSSILSPLIAVIIAVWSGISSRKATAKQLSAIKESTSKQVESIKALSKQMVEASIKQVELEIEKNQLLAKQAMQEWEEINKIDNSEKASQVQWKEIRMQQFREQKPERDYHLYSKFIKDLETIKKDLEANKNKYD